MTTKTMTALAVALLLEVDLQTVYRLAEQRRMEPFPRSLLKPFGDLGPEEWLARFGVRPENFDRLARRVAELSQENWWAPYLDDPDWPEWEREAQDPAAPMGLTPVQQEPRVPLGRSTPRKPRKKRQRRPAAAAGDEIRVWQGIDKAGWELAFRHQA